MEKIKLTKEWLEQTCKECYSYSEVLRKSGRTGGGSQQTLKKKIEEYQIDISHFKLQGWNKGLTAEMDERVAKGAEKLEQYTFDEIFCKNSSIKQKSLREKVKKYKVIPYKCECCGCDGNWQGGIISLELHHKDGDNTNNEIANLTYECPNCHALTDTYRGKNKAINNEKRKQEKKSPTISEEEFKNALETTPNIRQALLKLGLSAAGANYSRANEIKNKYNIIQKS